MRASVSPQQLWRLKWVYPKRLCTGIFQQSPDVEGLIDFIEDTLLSRINAIVQHKQTEQRIELIMQLLLIFAEHNPGICRILTGDALQVNQERLQERMSALYEKLRNSAKTMFTRT